MRTVNLILLVVAVIATSVYAQEVLVLDETTFDAAVAENENMLVKFYAPWCGHCKKLAPEYISAAATLGEKGTMAEVDCTVEASKSLCSKYGIKGFPTLKLFTSANPAAPSDYQQARTADALVSFMKKLTAPAYEVANTDAEFDQFVSSEPIVIVGFYESVEAAAQFTAIATAMRSDYTFVVAVGSSKGTDGTIAMYRDFDEAVTYTGAVEASELAQFFVAESFPPLGEIGPENFQNYVDRGLPLVWCFVDMSEQSSPVVDMITGVAKEFKGLASFVKLDGAKWKQHAEHFGLTEPAPGVVIEDRDSQKKYIFPQSNDHTDVELFRTFVQGFKDGTLTPHMKSEPVPETQGDVITIVGTTFEDIVMDKSKDVFVKFYAPWCGHCKTLAPIWVELGAEFADNDSIVISEVDATANDVPADIKGFPTLIFYPAGSKTPVTYQGARELDDLAAFVREKTANSAAAASGHDEL